MIQLSLKKSDVLNAIEKAQQHNFLDNLRSRHPVVAFDSKLRGYLGEIAFEKWLKSERIPFHQKNEHQFDSGMDVDFIFKGSRQYHLELKTSLLPDKDGDLNQAVQNRDIKLIQRGNKSIEEIEGDIHVQLLFNQLRLRKDDWLKKKSSNLLQSSIAAIYIELAGHRYLQDTFMVGWIDKETLITQIRQKKEHMRMWKYGQRQFWTCNLKSEARNPLDLKKYLKEL